MTDGDRQSATNMGGDSGSDVGGVGGKTVGNNTEHEHGKYYETPPLAQGQSPRSHTSLPD